MTKENVEKTFKQLLISENVVIDSLPQKKKKKIIHSHSYLHITVKPIQLI